MKILVLSDSHAFRSFMRQCVEAVKPDALIHLGDYFEDGQVLAEEYPGIPVYQVPGNCDQGRCPPGQAMTLIPTIGGVKFYLTHGHLHGVKWGRGRLISAARESGARIALYGHTHRPDCRQEKGLWVLNPGTCGTYGGSAGLIEIENGQILACRVMYQKDLEEFS